MPICSIIINSKNKISLVNLLFFLFNNFKVNLIDKYIKTKKTKKVITVLKSPHVNKKAQEQFEFRSFSKQFLLIFYNTSKLLILLKNIKFKLFPDVKIKIKFLIANKNSLKIKLKIFNPDNYTFNIKKFNYFTQKITSQKCKKLYNKKIKRQLIKKSKNYFKIFDCYGEFNLQIYV